MKTLSYLLFLLVLPIPIIAQNTFTLADLYRMADSTWPASKQTGISAQAWELRDANLKTAFYPKLDLNAGASWQSDVTEIPIDLPFLKMPDVPHDNYRITADVNQVIYDGGLNRSQREMEKLNLGIEQAGTERDMVQVKERINELFFSILVLQKKNELLGVLKSDLEKKFAELSSAVENGVVISSDADVLRAEILKTDQAITENSYSESAAVEMLSILSGKDLKGTKLVVPESAGPNLQTTFERPELTLFSLQQDKLSQYKNLLKSKRLPRLGGYGQAGYGKPGLNMLNNQFDSWFMIGARLSWNIWDWKQVKKEKHLTDLNIKALGLQKEAVQLNLNMQAGRYRQEIEKYASLVQSDAEIIKIKDRVAEVASSQLTNGVIRSSDYLREKNAALQAMINLEIHRIMLAKAKTDYKTILGEF